MLTLVTPPATYPVTLAEAKAHGRISHDDDDAQIEGFIAAATARLDGPDGLLGRCLITQTWRLTLPNFTRIIDLPLSPVQAITSITYLDDDRVVQTLPADAYVASGLVSIDGASLRPAYGTNWPALHMPDAAVNITFTAGYGSDPSMVPAPIRTAILMHVTHLYDRRESVTETGYSKETPMGYADLISDYRAYVF